MTDEEKPTEKETKDTSNSESLKHKLEDVKEKGVKKPKGRKHRSKYRDLSSDSESEESSSSSDEDSAADIPDDRLIVEPDEEDDLSFLDKSNIINGARTRGNAVDYSKPNALKTAGLANNEEQEIKEEEEEEEDDADFVPE